MRLEAENNNLKKKKKTCDMQTDKLYEAITCNNKKIRSK